MISQKQRIEVLDVKADSLSELLSRIEQSNLIIRMQDEHEKEALLALLHKLLHSW